VRRPDICDATNKQQSLHEYTNRPTGFKAIEIDAIDARLELLGKNFADPIVDRIAWGGSYCRLTHWARWSRARPYVNVGFTLRSIKRYVDF
jgi:hypothetical protein